VSTTLRTAVVGVGHFGAWHAEKYAHSQRCELVAVADIDGARAAAVGEPLGVAATADHRQLIGAVDAVSVCVPTGAHYQVAREFLEAGVHVLVEKPMTGRLETADRLIAIAERRGLVLQVGHIERFSSAYFALEKLVTRPLYFESYRIAPYRARGVDVDVVLDLMIHDIDLILALVDSPVASVDAVGAPVLSAQEDIASTRVKFANGCVASITASRVSAKTGCCKGARAR
jgi:predicted dehydrogenase